MNCGCKGKNHGHNCVCEQVKMIARAQVEAAEMNNDDCCDVTCKKSIEQLLSPTGTIQENTLDTIPFKLRCDCKNHDFRGTGVMIVNGCFKEIKSKYFRVKKFTSNCCAILELLIPVNCTTAGSEMNGRQMSSSNWNLFENFMRTGACFEADLNCFCSITCFPAVEALSAQTFGVEQALEAVEAMESMNEKN